MRNKHAIYIAAIVLIGALVSLSRAASTLSVCNMTSGSPVQVRVFDLGWNTLRQDWTTVGVSERSVGLSKSCYSYWTTLTAGHAYQIDWRDATIPTEVASEVIYETQSRVDASVSSIVIASYAEGNVRKTFHLASTVNNTRKVGIGKIDYITFEIKADEAADWSAPISTKYLYFWYTKLGDANPYKIGESD